MPPELSAAVGPEKSSYVYADAAWENILRMIPPDGKVIGSIGCGTGATEARLVEQGRIVHGVDISPQAIEMAKRRLTSARLVDPSDRAPFERASLDGLILADVIEHIPTAWDALASFSQAVRPGGWVVISVPNMRGLHVLKKFVFGGDWPEEPTGIFDATHVQMMSHKRLERWCRSAALTPERWFDAYDPHGPRRLFAAKLADRLTLRLLHRWFMFQIQVRCRKA